MVNSSGTPEAAQTFWKSMGEFWKKNYGHVLGLLLCAGTIAWMLHMISTASTPPSHREAAYQAIFLTLAGIFGSWFLARIQEQFRSDEGQRRLGTQIAQGVIVLSNQIDTLVQWVVSRKGGTESQEGQLVLDHIQESLRTLRSMSLLALGGLSDVIGGPLRRYEQIQSQILGLIGEHLEQRNVIAEKIDQAETVEDQTSLRDELAVLRTQFEQRMADLAKGTEVPIGVLVQQRIERVSCPSCNSPNNVAIRPVPGGTARVTCAKCSKKFNAHVAPEGTIFSREIPTPAPYPPPRAVSPEAELIRDTLKLKQALIAPGEVLRLTDILCKIDRSMISEGTQRTPNEVYKRLALAVTT